jgi:hypothetical protein
LPGLKIDIGSLLDTGRGRDDAEREEQEAPAADLRELSRQLIEAVRSGDEDGVADVLRAAFEVCQSAPDDYSDEG